MFLDGKGEMKYDTLHNPQCIAERLSNTFLYIQYTHIHTKAKIVQTSCGGGGGGGGESSFRVKPDLKQNLHLPTSVNNHVFH